MITEIFPNIYFLNIKDLKLISKSNFYYKKYSFKISKSIDKNLLKSIFRYFLKHKNISINIWRINKTTKKIYLTIFYKKKW
uniref:50S ribosomal protein L23 n=1 Tax=Nephromyces sp. ex Molgula occidentalis TaxID=2544991 RepID=A0A5C1H9N6_9APIC|nr:hypothetical protein [Nephromyces sp. ex Molgula occidentalis]